MGHNSLHIARNHLGQGVLHSYTVQCSLDSEVCIPVAVQCVLQFLMQFPVQFVVKFAVQLAVQYTRQTALHTAQYRSGMGN